MKRRTLPDPDKLLLRMMSLCAGAEHSTGEISSKLMRQGLSAEETSRIVERLVADKFIDDSRFARAYVNDKIKFSNWGRNKIRMGLLSKGISVRDVDAALRDIDMKEYGVALLRVARSKSKGLDLEDYQSRMRLYRMLSSCGYEGIYINKVIDYLRR